MHLTRPAPLSRRKRLARWLNWKLSPTPEGANPNDIGLDDYWTDVHRAARSYRLHKWTFGKFGGNYVSRNSTLWRIQIELPRPVGRPIGRALAYNQITKEEANRRVDEALRKNGGPFPRSSYMEQKAASRELLRDDKRFWKEAL